MATPRIDERFHPQLTKLGLKVAYYRGLAGLTQDELAEKIGVSRNTLSNIERTGIIVGLSLNTIFCISEALDTPVRDLFDFRDSKNE